MVRLPFAVAVVSAFLTTAVAHAAPLITYLRDAGKGCAWVRYEQPSTVDVIATFPTECSGAHFAWSKNGAYGAFLPAAGAYVEHLDLATRKTRRVPSPQGGFVKDVGFHGDDLITLVMSVEEHGVKVQRTKDSVTVELGGRSWEAPFDGDPGLAQAFRLEKEGWKRVEIVASTWGWDYASGVDALAIAKRLGPRSSILNGATHGFEVLDVVPKEMKEIRPRTKEPGHWARAGHAFVWAEDAEFPIPVAPLFVRGSKGFAALPAGGVKDGTPLSFDTHGDHLLVRDSRGFIHLMNAKHPHRSSVLGGTISAALWRSTR